MRAATFGSACYRPVYRFAYATTKDILMKVRNDARLKEEMKRDGIDVILTFSMENVFYLSGALFSLQDNIRERLSAAGMAADGSDFLLCATNETSAIEKDTHVGQLEGYVE